MLHQKLRIAVFAVCISAFLYCSSAAGMAQRFQSNWGKDVNRVWVGPQYWANRLQDWQISDGRLECVESRANKPMRTVHLLTRRFGDKAGGFTISVRTGLIGDEPNLSPNSATGFLIGVGSELDYRAAALVHHSPGPGGGLFAGINEAGQLFIRDFGKEPPLKDLTRQRQGTGTPKDIELCLSAKFVDGKYTLTLTSHNSKTGRQLGSITLEGVDSARLVGNLALVSHPGSGGNTGAFWFRDWKVTGSKVEADNDRLAGPVICTQYTLSRNILKMTAQMMPIGKADSQTAELQIRQNGRWRTVTTTKIITPGYTAPFRVENWNSTKDTPYRVVYDLKQTGGATKQCFYSGIIRHDPIDKPVIVIAGFTGNSNIRRMKGFKGVEVGMFPWTADGVWFPHSDVVKHVAKHKPDVLFFSGDQVYERASPTDPERTPLKKAELDYLYKWYLWCWAFGELSRDIPCICIPDDHDIYQGNLWGAGGRRTKKDDHGGYVMPAEWVKMVERTQTSHLPDPYDPTPVKQGIGVYYTAMNYGRISFAVLEDRKFKTGPAEIIKEKKRRPDHITDPNFDPKTIDVPQAKLLGDRQLKFLKDWAADWRYTDMKVVLSQTIFANVVTLHGGRKTYLVADLDSNGWPQSGRNRALRELRRGFAFHFAGDQHLATIVHHGIDDWDDAIYSFCVPSIANYYTRFWQPSEPGKNRKEAMPAYTGQFLDGLGNHITVWAAANPDGSIGRKPAELHDKVPGYGIVKLNKNNRTITMECWPRYADPNTGTQYPGWPKTINQTDNYGRKALAYLPTIKITGMNNPVVQVIDEQDSQVVYTLRIKGDTFRPKVFKKASYTIKIGEPETGTFKTLQNIQSITPDKTETIEVNFAG